MCCTRVENGPSGYMAPTVPEAELQRAVIDSMNAVLESSKDVIAILEENILEVISQDNSDEIEEINKTIAGKQKEHYWYKAKKTIQNVLMKCKN